MTIKEIAKLAGVSIATVSKVVNGKDKNIHADTRERVMKIVKQYNYRPYGDILSQQTARHFLVGVIVKKISEYPDMVESIVKQAAVRGYRVILCESNDNLDKEHENILQLSKHDVDCVIWEPMTEKSKLLASPFFKKKIPVVYIGDTEKSIQPDYAGAAELAVKKLVEKDHRQIALLAKRGQEHIEEFTKGYKNAMFQADLAIGDDYIFYADEKGVEQGLLFSGITGVVCLNSEVSALLLKTTYDRKMRIPQDISVITLCTEYQAEKHLGFSSVVRIPLAEFGTHICDAAIDLCEKKETKVTPFSVKASFIDRKSMDIPADIFQKRIVVVGNINLDIVLKVKEIPVTGKTVLVQNSENYPGGKGANQAVGVAKLGGNALLIGKLGYDFDGQSILQYLNDNRVNTSFIMQDKQAETGKAYIYVQQDSESSIAIFPGANEVLTAEEIEKRSGCFQGAKCCLIQTEIALPAALKAAQLAKKAGALTILKPSALNEVHETLFGNIDILVPNIIESEILSPKECKTLEQQAEYFMSKGIHTVIITAGANGCYVYTADIKGEHLPADDVESVDATGASDAFIAALSVALSHKQDIMAAVRYANTAAGVSVTREGAMSSLPDCQTLDRIRKEKQ